MVRSLAVTGGTMGMALNSNDLLPGEAVQLRKKANAVVNVADAGLKRYSHDQLMWTVGMQEGKRSAGSCT